MIKKLFALVVILLSVAALAQNAPLTTQTFSFNASPIALPGGRGTFVGTDAGFTFSPTQNFDLIQSNILSSDGKLGSFLGGVAYRFPAIPRLANNAMPNVSGFRMLFGVRALAGIDRIKDDAGNTTQHYSAVLQGTFAYALTSTGRWQFGANVGMARFPGYSKGWTPVVEVGPQFHF